MLESLAVVAAVSNRHPDHCWYVVWTRRNGQLLRSDLSVSLTLRLVLKICDRLGIQDRAGLFTGRVFSEGRDW